MRKLKPSFDDFEIEPSPQVWMKIESRLDDVPSSRKGWFFFSVAAIAVIGAVLFFTVFYDIDINVKPKHREVRRVSGTDTDNQKTSDVGSSQLVNVLPTAKKRLSVGFVNPEIKKRSDEINRIVVSEEKISSRHSNTFSAHLFPVKKKPVVDFQNGNTKLLLASAGTEPSIEKMEIINPFSYEAGLPIAAAYSNEQGKVTNTKLSLSRWEVSLGAAYEYNYRIINYKSRMSVTEREKEYFKNEKGIHSVSYSASVSYNLSTHYSIVSGISYLSAGQERNQSEVTQETTVPAVIKNVYSVNSSTGTVINSSTELDQVYYSSLDSAPVVTFANPGYYPVTAHSSLADFKFRQQFYFVSIPLMIRYQAAERRLTPYFGLGFSVDYLVSEKTVFNGKELNSQYLERLNRILLSGEAQAGIKFKVNRHFSCFAQPSLRYGLNALNNNQVKWIPYAWGMGAGLNYRF